MKNNLKALGFVLVLLFNNLIFVDSSSAALYSFTSHTFTNCSTTGASGPSIASCRTAYSTTWDENNSYLTVTNGVQLWTVPQSGSYTITAAGAVGGFGRVGAGGYGAIISGTFNLTEGSKIRILVGQSGTGNSGLNGGGGGGTFVIKETDNSTAGIFVIAGGGGGGGYTVNGSTVNASTSTGGQAGWNGNGTSSLNNGTTSGNGGSVLNNSGGGGGGFTGNGNSSAYVSCPAGQNSIGGTSFTNGGTGGAGVFTGGFGGGGSGEWCYYTGGGGGGGYSGGSGGYYYGNGGGGGSYNNGTSQSSSISNSGQGYVIITSLTTPPTISISPLISGTTTNGQVLSSSTGTWTDTPTSYTYQWSRAVTSGGTYNAISGAVNSTYTLTSSDVGKFLKVAVTAINSGGSTTDTSTATISSITAATSSATITIAVGALYYRTAKTISATPSVAGKITFKANNVIISGCKNLSVIANTAKSCSFKPNTRGYVNFSVTLAPTDSGYLSATATSKNNFVYQRSGNR